MVSLRIILPAIALSLAALAGASECHSHGASVFVNGENVLTFATADHGAPPAERARKLAARLSALADGASIDVSGDNADRVLLIDSKPFLHLTQEEAEQHKMTVAALAIDVADRLKQAWELPPIRVSDNYVKLPVGGCQTVRVIGSAAAHAQLLNSDKTVTTVARTDGGIFLSAKGVGKATVSIQTGTTTENVEVEVQPFAANFPQKYLVEVTGAPATASTVAGAVQSALHAQIVGVPDVAWTYPVVQTESIEPGRSETYTVKTGATAANAFPTTGDVDVTVKNVALPTQTDDSLFYSNNPETIRHPGPLFSADLKLGTSARLLYHHVNGTMDDMFVRVEAVNDSGVPARVMVIPGDSTPDKDPVRAGLNAADQFMPNWATGSGEVITIPAESVLPISLRRLSPQDTASGLCAIRLVDGPPQILIRTDSFPPLPLDAHWQNVLFSSAAWHEVGTHPINEYDRVPTEQSPQIYPNPYVNDTVSYQVGGRFTFFRIGQKPIERKDLDGALDGNFGVIYTIRANLKNPTADPTDVEIVFEASAGYSGGLFLVNGNYLKARPMAPKATVRLGKYHLLPNSSQVIEITTVPLSGSSYPATLMIRPVSDADSAAVGTPSPHGS
jgi:hypothetical protein